MKKQIPIQIDWRFFDKCPEWLARKIWDTLFFSVGVKQIAKWEQIEQFLIDLGTFTTMIKDGCSKFYWTADKTGMTDVKLYPIFDEYTYRIELYPQDNKVLISQTDIESEISTLRST